LDFGAVVAYWLSCGERAKFAHKVFEILIRRRFLAEHAPRGIAAPDTELHSSMRDALQGREETCGNGNVAHDGIRDKCTDVHALGVVRPQRHARIRLLP
jgi:hypothetical protein